MGNEMEIIGNKLGRLREIYAVIVDIEREMFMLNKELDNIKNVYIVGILSEVNEVGKKVYPNSDIRTKELSVRLNKDKDYTDKYDKMYGLDGMKWKSKNLYNEIDIIKLEIAFYNQIAYYNRLSDIHIR